MQQLKEYEDTEVEDGACTHKRLIYCMEEERGLHAGLATEFDDATYDRVD